MKAIEILQRIADTGAKVLFVDTTTLYQNKDEFCNAYGVKHVGGKFLQNCPYVFCDRELNGYDVLLEKDMIPIYGYEVD